MNEESMDKKLKDKKEFVPFIAVFLNLIFGIIMSVELTVLYLGFQLQDFSRSSYNYINTLLFFRNSYIVLLIFGVLYIFSNMILYKYLSKKYDIMNYSRYTVKIILITLIPVLVQMVFRWW